MDIGEHRRLLKVTPMTDQEDVARLLSKYNLLAVPVVDEHGHLLGTITVDDVIDAVVREQTEDLHKLGGLEALDEPYTQIGFATMIKKRAGWLCALFLGDARDVERDRRVGDDPGDQDALAFEKPCHISP